MKKYITKINTSTIIPVSAATGDRKIQSKLLFILKLELLCLHFLPEWCNENRVRVTYVNNDTVTFLKMEPLPTPHFFFYWPLPRMLYRLCKNIYRLHVVFVCLFLNKLFQLQLQQTSDKTLNNSSKENKTRDSSYYHNLHPTPAPITFLFIIKTQDRNKMQTSTLMQETS